ncbi:hypothetical protein C8Q77DRAFT_519457 [Trametes polyzona]|nr:hypothetical protein C8Q77DRAFT_519457 [Trametes polyzona]
MRECGLRGRRKGEGVVRVRRKGRGGFQSFVVRGSSTKSSSSSAVVASETDGRVWGNNNGRAMCMYVISARALRGWGRGREKEVRESKQVHQRGRQQDRRVKCRTRTRVEGCMSSRYRGDGEGNRAGQHVRSCVERTDTGQGTNTRRETRNMDTGYETRDTRGLAVVLARTGMYADTHRRGGLGTNEESAHAYSQVGGTTTMVDRQAGVDPGCVAFAIPSRSSGWPARQTWNGQRRGRAWTWT